MKLAAFFNYLKPTEVISIVDEFGLYVEPVEYQNLKYNLKVLELYHQQSQQTSF